LPFINDAEVLPKAGVVYLVANHLAANAKTLLQAGGGLHNVWVVLAGQCGLFTR
jgi:hypothetical protein